ncbi:MAG: cephalosporin-C deacetylase-like acetyl esterase, partial [Planctomycetaceae bacterium]
MNCKLRNTARLTCLVVMAAVLSPSASTAAEKTLPNTQPLTITQPLDEFMIDGLDRFCLRELAASPARREKMWNRDFSSTEAYEKSIAPNRERFREYIGAVDQRLTNAPGLNDSFEFLQTFSHPSSVAGSAKVKAHRVRWQVLEGVTAEGLLLIPETAKAAVVALPDADWTPEAFCGLVGELPKSAQLPWRLANEGCLVVVPMLISRSNEFSGSPYVSYTNQTHREFIYRQAFEMGRHVIGYEVQKTLAAIDLLERWKEQTESDVPTGVAGIGEGSLLALYTSAIDPRVDATMVCGYFGLREGVWEEPIYRNVWGLLTEFGDAELAGMIAPRSLIIEACRVPESAGPPTAAAGRRGGAAPGKVETVTLGSVRAEFDRATAIYVKLKAAENCQLHSSGEGDGSAGTQAAIRAFAAELGIKAEFPLTGPALAPVEGANFDEAFFTDRQRRQIDELQRHVQDLMRLSPKVRDKVWAKGDRSSVEKWEATSASLRDWTYDELIGRLPEMNLPMNAKSRLVLDEPEYLGYEITLDCYRDVVAGGILLLPKDLKPGEKRPVVVCQHGLEGTP